MPQVVICRDYLKNLLNFIFRFYIKKVVDTDLPTRYEIHKTLNRGPQRTEPFGYNGCHTLQVQLYISSRLLAELLEKYFNSLFPEYFNSLCKVSAHAFGFTNNIEQLCLHQGNNYISKEKVYTIKLFYVFDK